MEGLFSLYVDGYCAVNDLPCVAEEFDWPIVIQSRFVSSFADWKDFGSFPFMDHVLEFPILCPARRYYLHKFSGIA